MSTPDAARPSSSSSPSSSPGRRTASAGRSGGARSKIDSAAAARALNSSSPTSPSARTKPAAANGNGSPASKAASGSSAAGAASVAGGRDRRSVSGNGSSVADRLPTTRVSVASRDKEATASSAAAALAGSNDKGSTAFRKSARSSIVVTAAAPPSAAGTGAGGKPHTASDSLGPAAKDTTADTPSSDDAVSIRSTHTLKTIHGSPAAFGIKLNGNGSAADANASGGPGLLLLPSADDADEETGAIDVHAWQGAPSAGIGSSRTDLENGGIPTDPVELSRWRRQVLLRTGIRLFILFVVCTIALVGTLWIALPTIDEKDRPFLKIPKSLADLKALNAVLQHYKSEHYARVALCWIVVYMFLQAFSIPGSMYMSILAGALWGVPVALPLVCFSVATGATICYLISQTMGEALVAVPKWKARVDSWKGRLAEYNDNLLSYMILIRMMPLPPHNVVNLLAPHLGISIPLFWVSTALGIFAVSFIHTTIGEKLDDMASSDDFHLISARNALLFLGVCGAVMIPVLIRKRAPVAPLEEAEDAQGAVRLPDDEEDGGAPRSGTGTAAAPTRGVAALGRSILGIGSRGLGLHGRDADEEEEDDDDDDFTADYDEDADELPPVSDPDALAAAASRSRASSLNRAASKPKPARVLRPEGPPGPEDLDDEDATEAWRARPFDVPGNGIGDDSDVSETRSEDSHLSAPFSDDRREDRDPGRERGPRRRGRAAAGRAGAGAGAGAGRRASRPGTWAGAGQDAFAQANAAVGEVAGRVRSWFGGSNGVALR